MQIEVLRRAQPIHICGDVSLLRLDQVQLFRKRQYPRAVLFKEFQTSILAADSANAAQHWEKVSEQNAHVLFRQYCSCSEKHIGEKRLDSGQKVYNLVIKVSENIL